MDRIFCLIVTVILNGLNVINTQTVQLTSVGDYLYAVQLFFEVANPDRPSQREMMLSAEIGRKEICAAITNSPYFRPRKEDPLVLDEQTYAELKDNQPKYEKILERITVNDPKLWRPYANPYTLSDRVGYTFLCFVRDRSSGSILAYEVTKEYNVFVSQSSLSSPVAGRFLFPFPPPRNNLRRVILAEEPSKVYDEKTFDIEAHYLRLRNAYHQEADAENDPLCKLISPSDPTLNQKDRICSSILGSEFFKNRNVVYVNTRPEGRKNDECKSESVSIGIEDFTNAETDRVGLDGEYSEWMTSCEGQRTDSDEGVQFYVSRAYCMGQMFVYYRPSSSDTVRLLNLSTNLSIVDIVSEVVLP